MRAARVLLASGSITTATTDGSAKQRCGGMDE